MTGIIGGVNRTRVAGIVLLTGLAFLLALSGCAVVSGSTFGSVLEAEERASGDEDDAEQGERSGTAPLRVVTTPDDAEVYLDGRLVGSTPLAIESIEPGSYLLVLEKNGYHEVRRWIDVPESGSTVIELDLEQITGFIDVAVTPADATVLVDSEEIDEGFAEMPIGSYRVAVRRFGYRLFEARARVREDEVTRLSVELEPAPFEVDDLSTWRSAFNPENPGRVGTTLVGYEVSAPGEGELVIRDEAGSAVMREREGPYETWEQEYRWDGTDDQGRTVPDGLYEVTLSATGDDGRYEEAQTTVRVDRSLVVRFRSIWSATPGLLYAPTRSALPSTQFQVSTQVAGIVAPTSNGFVARFPGRLGARVGLGAGVELFGYGGFVAQTEPIQDRAEAGGAVSWDGYSTTVGPATLGAGIAAGGSWRSPTADGRYAGPDTQASFPGVFVSLPLSARLGVVSLHVAPEYRRTRAEVVYGSAPLASETWGSIGYLRSGLLVDTGRFSVGASAALRSTRFEEGFSLELPFQAGLETHWIIPQSSVALSAFAAGEFDSASDFYAIGGLGIGVLF